MMASRLATYRYYEYNRGTKLHPPPVLATTIKFDLLLFAYILSGPCAKQTS